MPRLLAPGLVLALALAAVPAASAAPPGNDNYLASKTINLSAEPFTETVDTTEATTQADLFDPNRDGLPFGGSGPEPVNCPVAPSFGKTVWYDFAPPTPGGVRIATSGFDNVIAVYEWNLRTSQLGRLIACQNASEGVSEELQLQPEIHGGRNYTIQLGGVGGIGGPLSFSFEYFQDTDGDQVLDEDPDKCLRLAGIRALGGCPPAARGGARVVASGVGTGIRVDRLFIDLADRGSRVEVRCRRCGRTLRTRAKRAGNLRVRGFEGRVLPAGDRLTVRVSHPRTSSGRYRFGAITRETSWPIANGALGGQRKRCFRPASRKRITCPRA
jgi:hypothetical protein